jgi:uncharacterized protein YjbJ (UPF0337 family)
MNDLRMNGRWQDIRNEVKNVWGHLDADEIKARGENISALSELIQEKYGDAEETIVEKLESILNQFGPTIEDIKNLINHQPQGSRESQITT